MNAAGLGGGCGGEEAFEEGFGDFAGDAGGTEGAGGGGVVAVGATAGEAVEFTAQLKEGVDI